MENILKSENNSILNIIWQGLTDKVTMGWGGLALFISGINGTWLLGIAGTVIVSVLGIVKHMYDIKLSRTRQKEAEVRLEKERLELKIMREQIELEITQKAQEILKFKDGRD